MNEPTSRRDLFLFGGQSALAAGVLTGLPIHVTGSDNPPDNAAASLWPGFPRQNPKLVAEVVGMSHRNLARVKELVTAHPALVNAWWDWGFGDWESPLGAASHTGRREIAEFLLERGARIDIFAATMLGMTTTVKALILAQPGVQRTLGPHGITLLKHARAGGKWAEETLAYLEQLGDADIGHPVTALAVDKKEGYLGKYAAVEGDVRLECKLNSNGLLMLEVQAGKATPTSQIIHHVSEDAFFPSGVPSVRIRFQMEKGKATAVTIQGSEIQVAAKRVKS